MNHGEGHGDESVGLGLDEEEVQCRAHSEWKATPINDVSIDDAERSDEMKSAKVWLLGNEWRRDHPMRTVKLSTSTRIQEALAEEELVSRFWTDN